MFVWRFSGCTLQRVLNRAGEQYRFDLTANRGDGVGCADTAGDGRDELVGYRLSKPLGGYRAGDRVTISTTAVRLDGVHATNGATTRDIAVWPKDRAAIEHAATVTCSDRTLKRDGLQATRW